MRNTTVAGFVLALANLAPAMGLHGMAPAFGQGNYSFGKIDENTAAFSPLATINLFGVVAVNQMTYSPVIKKYVFTAYVDTNNAYLVTLDPHDYTLEVPAMPFSETFVEGVEYSSALGGLVLAFGSNNYSNHIVLMDGSFQSMAMKFIAAGMDMDCLFVSGPESSLNRLDVNNNWMGHQRHIVNDPFGSTTYVWTGADYWNASHTDVAYLPTNGMIYATQGSSLAVVNSLVTPPATIGSYGGYNVTALANGPDSRTVQGTIILNDTLASFSPISRMITVEVVQGSTVLASSNIFMNSNAQFFQFPMLDDANGPADVVFNGSSFLKTKVPVNLSSSFVLTGPVNLQNGDPDFSGEVDAADIDLVIARFGNTYPSALPDPDSDVDCSGEVDAADIDIVIANFGGEDD